MNHEVISKIIITVLTSFVFVLIAVPFIKNIAIQINAVDNNMGGRHIHKKPVTKSRPLTSIFSFTLSGNTFPMVNLISSAVLSPINNLYLSLMYL